MFKDCTYILLVITYFSHYKGAADKSAAPLAFVGKGITFDSGGISLKPGAVGVFFDSPAPDFVECV